MPAKKRRMRNFNVRLPDELVSDLDKIAGIQHLERSDIVRRFLYNKVHEAKEMYGAAAMLTEDDVEKDKSDSSGIDDRADS